MGGVNSKYVFFAQFIFNIWENKESAKIFGNIKISLSFNYIINHFFGGMNPDLWKSLLFTHEG